MSGIPSKKSDPVLLICIWGVIALCVFSFTMAFSLKIQLAATRWLSAGYVIHAIDYENSRRVGLPFTIKTAQPYDQGLSGATNCWIADGYVGKPYVSDPRVEVEVVKDEAPDDGICEVVLHFTDIAPGETFVLETVYNSENATESPSGVFDIADKGWDMNDYITKTEDLSGEERALSQKIDDIVASAEDEWDLLLGVRELTNDFREPTEERARLLEEEDAVCVRDIDIVRNGSGTCGDFVTLYLSALERFNPELEARAVATGYSYKGATHLEVQVKGLADMGWITFDVETSATNTKRELVPRYPVPIVARNSMDSIWTEIYNTDILSSEVTMAQDHSYLIDEHPPE